MSGIKNSFWACVAAVCFALADAMELIWTESFDVFDILKYVLLCAFAFTAFFGTGKLSMCVVSGALVAELIVSACFERLGDWGWFHLLSGCVMTLLLLAFLIPQGKPFMPYVQKVWAVPAAILLLGIMLIYTRLPSLFTAFIGSVFLGPLFLALAYFFVGYWLKNEVQE